MTDLHGHDWVWGIDVAVERVDVGLVAADGRWQTNSTVLPKRLSGSLRLATLFHQTRTFASALAEHFPPLIVYVENPTGRFPNPPLMMAAGIIRTAIYDGLHQLYAHPVDVEMIAVKDWKKVALGYGNSSKEQVLAWARQLGYEGTQDGADALGIATAAALECNVGSGPRIGGHLPHAA